MHNPYIFGVMNPGRFRDLRAWVKSWRLKSVLPCCARAGLIALPSLLLGQESIALKNRRELFVDDFIVLQVSGLDYRLGVPRAAGVALNLDQPWEGRASAYVSIASDGKKFQMYYRGGFGAKDNENLTCYAESADGVRWERPNLGLFAVKGSK